MSVETLSPRRGATAGGASALPARPLRARAPALAIRQPLPRLTSLTLSVSFFLVLLGLWAGATGVGLVSPFFLPSPWQVLRTGWQMAASGSFLADVAVSVYRVLAGYLLAATIAVPLGLLMGTMQVVRSLLEPCLAFTRYMPATAFIPLLVLWLGIDDAQKFAVIFVGTFFTLTLMVMVSAAAVPLSFVEAGIMLGASSRQLILRVILPAAKPAIFNDLRIVLGWAWTYIVVAEIVAASSGIGYVILNASRFMDTATIFVGIFSIGVIGLVSDLCFNAAGRWLFPYIQTHRA